MDLRQKGEDGECEEERQVKASGWNVFRERKINKKVK